MNNTQCPSTGLFPRAAGGTTFPQQSYRMLPVTHPQQPNLRACMLHGCNFTVLAPSGIFPVAFARGTIMLQACSEWPSSAPVAENPARAHNCRKAFRYVAFSRRLLQQLLKQTPPHCHSIVTELRARGQDLTHRYVIFFLLFFAWIDRRLSHAFS